MEASTKFDRVCVALRERPIMEDDLSNVRLMLRVQDGQVVAFAPGASEGLMYSCDYYFPCDSKQEDLYHTIGMQMIEHALQGLSSNVVVFGYADTGKTYTLYGDDECSGLIHDTVGGLYERLQTFAQDQDVNITVRYWDMNLDAVEDNFRDGDNETKVLYAISRDSFNRLIIPNLTALEAPDFETFMSLLERGNKQRVRRARERMARWHGFIQLTITTSDKEEGDKNLIRTMTFVHMKGTDCVGMKDVRDAPLREGFCINVSVTLLRAAIIHSLSYRDKRRSQASTPEKLRKLICGSQSFFMECNFSRLMSQYVCGLEASFVIGCTSPLQYHETVNTLEGLQYFRRLECSLKPIVVMSERGLLMRELRRQEDLMGPGAVAELYSSDVGDRPLTEREEKLLETYRKLHGFDPRVGGDDDFKENDEAAIIERCKTRAQPVRGKVATHGQRKRIFLTSGKYPTYEGQWENGKFGGFGELLTRLTKYRGEFREGLREGEGTLWVRKDLKSEWVRVYKGEWLADKRDGFGTSWEDNGDIYEGGWCNDKRHGSGRHFLANGEIYKGEFREGLYHGRALLLLTNGDWYDGFWALGLREGPGMWCYVRRQQYLVGEWSKGVFKCGTMSDMPDKVTNDCSRFIPRLGLLRDEEVLGLEQRKLHDRRVREFAKLGITWTEPVVSPPLGAGARDMEVLSNDASGNDDGENPYDICMDNVADGWGLDVE
ncbi:hypothetical protein TRVL_06264 [Trypanosoma vivax]|nr:hypothetical protein TRVL_06264 [Trypanosoma vivax]